MRALLVGNSDYEQWPDLEVAHTDGHAMRDRLRHIGYRVISIDNGTKADIEAALAEFGAALAEECDPAKFEEHPQDHVGERAVSILESVHTA